MPDYTSITVTSIFGHNDGASAIPAILRSMKELPGSKGLLLSTQKPQNLPPQIDWTEILPLDYRQYSLFVMFSLHNFIQTEFCLIVQDDGWVINGKSWKKEYFDYDYIGGPCHAAFVGSELVPAYQWVGTSNPTPLVIQNGGLSLRSKKFLKAPSCHGALYYFSEEQILQNEDVQLTGIYRPQLEELGIKFAPNNLAKQFSVEYLGPIFHDDIDLLSLLAVHGQTRKLIEENTIQITIPKDQLQSIHREEELLNYLSSELHYNIRYIA
ncbi:DUF5672 family protein [Polynucleobacter asymbioticus]|uniref:DUF5672 domain-containing protein n=2 Tax=Polynucleobacter asymbioticus TaxID=576611 RepID=A4SZV2_POLAQ|nr:DUF5672 family protein [Polynucleobacter asymbioticus]ABP35016.1 hypothetical protein Pnuc_1803 [Polynucleobacter asymbioticus QLW-P1DMWA-1]APB99643.1 hypothetical protein A4F89_10010 [Polynucleobacter asymbioticus]APC01949.1 hypothetical protein AOC25_10145 [Polynucleobacter asymbioticus]